MSRAGAPAPWPTALEARAVYELGALIAASPILRRVGFQAPAWLRAFYPRPSHWDQGRARGSSDLVSGLGLA